jgi:threonine synthase
MEDLIEREERYTVLPAELSAVQQYVAEHRR